MELIAPRIEAYRKDYVIAKEELLSMPFVANSKSKFAGKKNIKMQDIVNEPFVLTEYGQGYRRVFDKKLAFERLKNRSLQNPEKKIKNLNLTLYKVNGI